MNYKKGDKVRHPNRLEWGLGIILDDEIHEKVRVFFENVGEKVLSTKFFMPSVVTGSAAKHPILDQLTCDPKQLGLTTLLSAFLSKYPDGFQDPHFLEKEVYHKQEISDFAMQSLNQVIFAQMLTQLAYAEITDIIKSIIHKDTFSMIDRFEKMALIESLEKQQWQQIFAHALYDLIYGQQDDFDRSFMAFAHVLSEMKANKWTVITYFLFVFHPQHHVFLKPTVIQNIANVCEFNLHYEATLNTMTYHRALRLSHDLFRHLRSLGLMPEDMVDIQSFMWVLKNIEP